MPAEAAGALGPADEGRHDGAGGALHERWDFAADGDRPGGLIRLALSVGPGPGPVEFQALVRAEPETVVVIVAPDLALPRGAGLELRGPGLWADHNVEEPFVRWSLGLEAFGVAVPVDPGADLDSLAVRFDSPDLRGALSPLGWDLEWISTGPPEVDAADPDRGAGYRLACRVDGEVQVGSEVLVVDGPGHRSHHW